MKYLGEGPMSLEDFVALNMRAAIILANDTHRRHLLNGETTLAGATAYLLQLQLASKGRDKSPRAEPVRRARRTSHFKGVYQQSRGGAWYAACYVKGRGKVFIKGARTQEEAARAFDKWAEANGRPTNVQLGLLPPEE